MRSSRREEDDEKSALNAISDGGPFIHAVASIEVKHISVQWVNRERKAVIKSDIQCKSTRRTQTGRVMSGVNQPTIVSSHVG